MILDLVLIHLFEANSNKMSSPKKKKKKEMQKTHKTRVRSLGQEDPLEEEMASHSSILAWRIPWTEETGRVTKIQT